MRKRSTVTRQVEVAVKAAVLDVVNVAENVVNVAVDAVKGCASIFLEDCICCLCLKCCCKGCFKFFECLCFLQLLPVFVFLAVLAIISVFVWYYFH